MRWLVVLTLAGCRALLGIDEPVGDIRDGNMAIDGSPETINEGSTCYGSGLFTFCPDTPPMVRAFTANTTFDTTSGVTCDAITAQNYCVIVASSVTIGLGVTVRGVGTRALVVVATDQINVQGILTVSSVRGSFVGSGVGVGLCGGVTPPENDVGGGGGGAGGSFSGRGGSGGVGDLNDSGGGDGTAAGGVAALSSTPTAIRAGCGGSKGGDGSVNTGIGGSSGGAVYLIAGNTITISGNVTANGAGGSAGQASGGGGGGGGSGGFIGFDAPTVMATGTIAANGGGGAEGAGSALAGAAGADGGSSATPAPGGSGAAVDGGEGGQGSGGATVNGGNGLNENAGAGGGGGGAGYVYVKANSATLNGIVSPAASMQ